MTVRQAAEHLGITYRQARQIVGEYNLGTLVNPRLRMLSPDDVEELERINSQRSRGNNGPRDERGRFSSPTE